MPRVFLLDGTALAYRSHFAMARSGLTNAEGRPTGATYGFTMTLRRILEKEAPELIAVAFDPPGPTFRHKQYKEYKATREKMPEDLVGQLDDMRDVVRAHGIPIFEVPGFEADDVLGTLTRQAEAAGCEVMLVTGDKDLMQLVGPTTKLYNVFKPKVDLVIQGLEEVREKFGTTPDHVIDVLAIMGDSSDNIPGVKGIGEVGATKLIADYGSVAGVLEHIEEVKGKAREKLENDRENLLLSLDLVTIRTDMLLEPGFEIVGAAEPDVEKLAELFRTLDFQSLAKKVLQKAAPSAAAGSSDEGDSAAPARPSDMSRDYVQIRNEAELDAMIEELTKAGSYAVDTETTSLSPMQADLVGISFSASDGRAFYVPANAKPPVLEGGTKALLEKLTPLLTSPELQRTAQNAKYDWLVFAHNGLRLPPPDFDTMVASFCAAGSNRRHNLDQLALTFFDLHKIPTSEIIGKGKAQVTMDQIEVEKVAEYACEDADVTFRLRAVLEKELEEAGTTALFHELEMPLVPVLAAMEERGIRLNAEKLIGLSGDLGEEITKLEHAIQELAGENFKVSSPKQLGSVLFEKLAVHVTVGVKRPKRTKTGWATDAATLSEKYGHLEIVKKVLEFRELTKLKGTYVDALPEHVNPATGRIHCSFSQIAAATGRLASSNPNLQNIPVRTERGRQLREAFIPREPDEHGEWVLLAADYSQVELRIMAHFAGDEKMQAAFAEGRDIHASTASIVFGVKEEDVDREMRSRAKAINFGLLYGMGPNRLARETGLDIFEAIGFIERYFESFPSVRGWIDSTLESAREKGYVETLMGRRRYIPDITAENQRFRSAAENVAVNTPIQGSAADVIKRAMINLEARLSESELSGQLLLQVHDELVLEVPLKELEQTQELVRECMEGAVDLSVPLNVDFGHGANWLEAH
ncbi:MAG: DNA polymerase I [Planctomycetota bacterium]|nr:DNA polymerase I [Planctomycetota bacterium]